MASSGDGSEWVDRYTPGDSQPGSAPVTPSRDRASDSDNDDDGELISVETGDSTTGDAESDSAFSLDDLMDAIQVAGEVPKMEGVDPRTSLEALGVPLRSPVLSPSSVSQESLLALDYLKKLDTPEAAAGDVEGQVSEEHDAEPSVGPVTYITEAIYTRGEMGNVKEQKIRQKRGVKMFRPSISAAEISVDNALDKYIVDAAVCFGRSDTQAEAVEAEPEAVKAAVIEAEPAAVEAEPEAVEAEPEPAVIEAEPETVDAEPEQETERGVCSSYQIDFSAKTFGLCHCGHFRKDHGKRTSISGSPADNTDAQDAKKQDILKVEDRAPLARQNSGPTVCGEYRIDFSAKSFGLCVCGYWRKDHGGRTSVSGLEQLPLEALRAEESAKGAALEPRVEVAEDAALDAALAASAVSISIPDLTVKGSSTLKKDSPASVASLFQAKRSEGSGDTSDGTRVGKRSSEVLFQGALSEIADLRKEPLDEAHHGRTEPW
jgi:hypothetical protein